MDAYIQHKHDLFMKKEYPKKASNVFDRLDKDKKEREERNQEIVKKAETISFSVVNSSERRMSRQVSIPKVFGDTQTSSK